MSRVFAYSRVSTDIQSGVNQKVAIEKAGYEIKKGRYFEDIISGKTTSMSRPQFSKMVDRLEEGDVVVVYDLSRLGRDAMDVMSTVKMFKELQIKLIVLQFGTLDLTSPTGEFIINVVAAVAEMERALLIERVNDGLAVAKQNGIKLGRPSKTSDTEKEEIKTLKEKGYTISSIAKKFGISRATVLNILK